MSRYSGPVVDIDLHFGPTYGAKDADFLAYMPKEWRDYFHGMGRIGPHTGSAGGFGALAPHHAQLASAYNEKGQLAGYEWTQKQLLDKNNFYKLIMSSTFFGETLNPYAAPAVARAVNDWTRDAWLDRGDDRLASVIHLPPANATEAAAEVRRLAPDPRFVAIQHCGAINGLPYGDPVYDPIYEAAVETGRPLHLHPNQSARYNQVATGPATTALQGVVMSLSAFAMHYLTSFLVHGTFEKFPTLKVVFKEFGATWHPHLMWRLDRSYEVLKAESPWVKKLPSEYIREHVYIGTHPLEQGFKGDGSDVVQVLQAIDGIEDMLMYCSDYPHMNFDDPSYISGRLPKAWHRKVMLENACKLHGWEVPVTARSGPAALVAS